MPIKDAGPPPILSTLANNGKWASLRDTQSLAISTFEYMAEGWVVTVSFPSVAPEAIIYRVTLLNPTTGFHMGR